MVASLILGIVVATAHGAAVGRPPSGELDGAWLSDNGLDLLQFDGESLTWSEITPFGRIDPPRTLSRVGTDGSAWRFNENESRELEIRFDAADPNHVILKEAVELLPLRFARLERRPDAARTVAAADPRTAFDVMAAIVKAECPCLGPRRIDWDRIVAQQREKIGEQTTPKELFQIMTGALDQVDDAHFALEGGGSGDWAEPGPTGKRFTKETDFGRLRRLVDERYAMAPLKSRCERTICYGRLANLVGYVRIDSFERPGSAPGVASREEAERFVRDLDEIMRELDFVESLILDLRSNPGGCASAVEEIASRFMRPGAPLLVPVRRSDPSDPAALREGAPICADAAEHPRFLRRLLILTSHDTCSGGEVLPLALLGRDPPATRIGEATQGAFCAIDSRRLPNGWRLQLTCVALRSAKGESFEGRGLPPDVPVALFAGMDSKPPRDDALEKALALVGER